MVYVACAYKYQVSKHSSTMLHSIWHAYTQTYTHTSMLSSGGSLPLGAASRSSMHVVLDTRTRTHTHTHIHTQTHTHTHLNVIIWRQLALRCCQQVFDACGHDPVFHHVQLVQLRDQTHVAHHTLLYGTLNLLARLRIRLLCHLLRMGAYVQVWVWMWLAVCTCVKCWCKSGKVRAKCGSGCGWACTRVLSVGVGAGGCIRVR